MSRPEAPRTKPGIGLRGDAQALAGSVVTAVFPLGKLTDQLEGCKFVLSGTKDEMVASVRRAGNAFGLDINSGKLMGEFKTHINDNLTMKWISKPSFNVHNLEAAFSIKDTALVADVNLNSGKNFINNTWSLTASQTISVVDAFATLKQANIDSFGQTNNLEVLVEGRAKLYEDDNVKLTGIVCGSSADLAKPLTKIAAKCSVKAIDDLDLALTVSALNPMDGIKPDFGIALDKKIDF
jgi:hypothetical protein